MWLCQCTVMCAITCPKPIWTHLQPSYCFVFDYFCTFLSAFLQGTIITHYELLWMTLAIHLTLLISNVSYHHDLVLILHATNNKPFSGRSNFRPVWEVCFCEPLWVRGQVSFKLNLSELIMSGILSVWSSARRAEENQMVSVCFLDLQVPLLPPLFTDKRPPPSSSGFPSTRRSVLIFRHYGYYYYYLDIILAIICGRGRGKTCCLCSSSIILSSLPQEHWVILAPWWGRFNAWKCWNWNTGGG